MEFHIIYNPLVTREISKDLAKTSVVAITCKTPTLGSADVSKQPIMRDESCEMTMWLVNQRTTVTLESIKDGFPCIRGNTASSFEGRLLRVGLSLYVSVQRRKIYRSSQRPIRFHGINNTMNVSWYLPMRNSLYRSQSQILTQTLRRKFLPMNGHGRRGSKSHRFYILLNVDLYRRTFHSWEGLVCADIER